MKIILVPNKISGAKNVKFRSITITSLFLKTMEKLLMLPLQPAIKEHIDPYQFAYRCKRSNLDAIAVLHHNIVFNLEKAFDSIPRQRLINKLINVNTDSWITNLLFSYLSGREQYTAFGGKCSESLLSHEGVPQEATCGTTVKNMTNYTIDFTYELAEFSLVRLKSYGKDPVVEYVYPSVNNENSHFHRLRNFVLPCKHKSLISEEYTLIFTDSDGTVEFFACITLPISGYIVCISSYFPYFELLHSIITLINQEHLYREENRRNIEVILKELHYHSGVATLNISSPPNSTRHWLIKRCNASHSAILRHIRSTENVASTAALLLARPYLELMAILLGRYRSALQHNEASSSVDLLPIQSPNDESRSQDKFDQPRIGGWFFDRAAFVISCGHELQPYLTELLNSQMVIQVS
ncbi:unnamed protein product [Schistosoma curassoni]|uniref:Reverse transcriptase domain-containing protein n=1 Tax=Schistosoma curassoni TaxID=6186 RepID=A0A183KHG6_9TREM|nr:unnamed protein product [Schistosoma curassoni]